MMAGGSSLVLADYFMNHIENLIFSKVEPFIDKIKFSTRYVDDVFGVGDGTVDSQHLRCHQLGTPQHTIYCGTS